MKTKMIKQNVLVSESGNTSILFLVSAVSLGLYISKYQPLVEDFNSMISKAILLILAIGIIFSFASILHSILSGSKSKKSFRKDARTKLDSLDELVIKSNERISKFEKALPKNTISISSEGLKRLGLVRTVLNSIEERINDVQRLLLTKNSIDLIDACDLLERDIQPGSNRMESVLDSAQMPAIEMANVENTVNRLIEEIEANTESNIKHAA